MNNKLKALSLAGLVAIATPACGGCDDETSKQGKTVKEQCLALLPDQGTFLGKDGYKATCKDFGNDAKCNAISDAVNSYIMSHCATAKGGTPLACDSEGDCTTEPSSTQMPKIPK